jgi:hypothetical protein|nr:MAG TPA: hypothetical protein [Caudoviricetes sp.]
MSKDMGGTVEDLREGWVREAHLASRSDFIEAFRGQVIVDYGKVAGTFEDQDAYRFDFANGTRLDLRADPFSDMDVDQSRKILGRKVAEVRWSRTVDSDYRDRVLRPDVTFEDGEDWRIFEAVGPKRVDLTGLMTKVETTD